LNVNPDLPADCFPLAVLMEHEQAQSGPWPLRRARAVGVVAGAALEANGRATSRAVHAHEGAEQSIWPGFAVQLHRDSAETYWYNLTGARPSLFVICRTNEAGELEPFLVTADYDEAGAYMEADDTVFSVPIPPEMYQWLERFVIEHYRPKEPGKRKRKNWLEEAGHGRAAPPSGDR
jgi:hypothetical protein